MEYFDFIKKLKERTQEEKDIYEKVNYRMYALVLTALNPMQKGIQALHSVVEYSNKFSSTDEYNQWALDDKTMIILDGGTAKEMESYHSTILLNNAYFKEEDLNDLTTAICFLVPSFIYDMNREEIMEVFEKYENDECDDFTFECASLAFLIKNKRLSR